MKLEAKNIFFSYDNGKKLLKNLSFSLNKGDFIAFIGKNGVGKTTFFKILTGFFLPNAGEVLLDGKNLQTFTLEQRAKYVTYMDASFNLNFNITVKHLLELSLNNENNIYDNERFIYINKFFNIESFLMRYFFSLSMGERQMVKIASLFLKTQHFILFDEPFSFMDPPNILKLMNFLKSSVKDFNIGISVIIHRFSLLHFFDTIAFLSPKADVLSVEKKENILSEEKLKYIYNGGDYEIIKRKERLFCVLKA